MSKLRRDVELRPTELTLTDTFTLINSAIDIDSSLLKQIAIRSDPKLEESVLHNASSKMS